MVIRKMSEALGGHLFIKPIFSDGVMWYGQVEDVGPIAIKFSTFKICDFVTYNKDSIYKSEIFNGEIVHIVLYENVDYDRE